MRQWAGQQKGEGSGEEEGGREREEGRRGGQRENWSMSVITSGMCVLPVKLVYQLRLVAVVIRPKHDSTILSWLPLLMLRLFFIVLVKHTVQ